MTLGQIGVLRYGHFVILEAKVVNLGPIGFLLGCPLNINVNGGQNKFEFKISKDMVKIANFQPKNGQDATIAQL